MSFIRPIKNWSKIHPFIKCIGNQNLCPKWTQTPTKEPNTSRILVEKNQTKQVYFILDSLLLTSMLLRNAAVFCKCAPSSQSTVSHLLFSPSTTPDYNLTQCCWENKSLFKNLSLFLKALQMSSLFPPLSPSTYPPVFTTYCLCPRVMHLWI